MGKSIVLNPNDPYPFHKFNEVRRQAGLAGVEYRFSYTGSSGYIDMKEQDQISRVRFQSKHIPERMFKMFGLLQADLKQRSEIVESLNLRYQNKRFPMSSYINPDQMMMDWSECYLVDLNSAYLYAALNLGLISEDTHRIIEKALAKPYRLQVIGMLGTNPMTGGYWNGIVMPQEEHPRKTRPLLNAIQTEVDTLMRRVRREYFRKEPSGCFYYVDGIFVQNPIRAKMIASDFEAAGYPCKIEPIVWLKGYNMLTYMDIEYLKEGRSMPKTLTISFSKDHVKRADIVRYEIKTEMEMEQHLMIKN